MILIAKQCYQNLPKYAPIHNAAATDAAQLPHKAAAEAAAHL
jgi:hypothetical protein